MRKYKNNWVNRLIRRFRQKWAIQLIHDKVTEYVIYVPESGKQDQYKLIDTCAQMQSYIEKVTGVVIPMVLVETDSKKIVVREHKSNHPDNYKVESSGNDIIISGGSIQGTQYGVYFFLDKFFGIRWFSPDEIGEHIPKIEESSFWKPIRINSTPDFNTRTINQLAGDEHSNASITQWSLRNGLGDYVGMRHNHNQHNIITPDYFEDHPEWFAMNSKGIRVKPELKDTSRDTKYWNYKLCLSNKEMWPEFAKQTILLYDKYPERKTISISPTDGGAFCKCPECKALTENGTTEYIESYTRLTLDFYNGVAEIVASTRPDIVMGGYIYGYYKKFPDNPNVYVHPNLRLILAANSARRLYRLPYRETWDELVKDWGEVVNFAVYYDFPCWLWDGWLIPSPPNKKVLSHMIPMLKENNVEGVFLYGCMPWRTGMAGNWIMSKLMWNANANLDELYNEFFSKCYGKGGIYIQEMYEHIESEFEIYYQDVKNHPYKSNDEMYKLITRNLKFFGECYNKAVDAQPDGIENERIMLMGKTLHIAYWVLYSKGYVDIEGNPIIQ